MAVAKKEVLTFDQVLSQIKSKNFAPVYLLTGEEPYYIDLLAKKFEQDIIDETSRDFNLDVVYGKDANANMLIGICRQYPMMSERRLLILKEAQMMDKRQWEAMALYLASPLQSTIFVICNKDKSFDIKTKNLLSKNQGVIFESKKVADYKLPEWIASYISTQGYSYQNEVLNCLADYLGNDLQKIANELSKMFINIPKGSKISLDNVIEFIGISRSYNVFELQDALAKKDKLKAFSIIDYFSKNPKESPIQMMLPILFSFFTRVLATQQLADKSPQAVASAIGVAPFMARNYIQTCHYYSMNQLFAIISFFEQYDLKSKGIDCSPMDTDADLMKELVFKILNV